MPFFPPQTFDTSNVAPVSTLVRPKAAYWDCDDSQFPLGPFADRDLSSDGVSTLLFRVLRAIRLVRIALRSQ